MHQAATLDTSRAGPIPLMVILERSRELGFLGRGPVQAHIEHARGFLQAMGDAAPERLIDLGSGGGVPGLVIADAWRTAAVVLIDSNERRTTFLADAAQKLALGRVRVVRGRAEDLGRDPTWRGWADIVVARSFGSPAVTAECAAPLLQTGGHLIVSEPPTPASVERWPSSGLEVLGLRRAGRVEGTTWRVQIVDQERPCPTRFPRRAGVAAKRPLF